MKHHLLILYTLRTIKYFGYLNDFTGVKRAGLNHFLQKKINQVRDLSVLVKHVSLDIYLLGLLCQSGGNQHPVLGWKVAAEHLHGGMTSLSVNAKVFASYEVSCQKISVDGSSHIIIVFCRWEDEKDRFAKDTHL